MNLLEIIILVMTLYLAFAGFRRGFVRKLASMLSLVLSILLVSATLPYVTDFLKENTPIYDGILRQCEKAVEEQTEKALENAGVQGAQSDTVLDQMGRIEQIELIENLPLPEELKDLLLNNNNAEGYKSLAVSTFSDYVTHLVADVVLNVLSFIVAVFLVQIILRVLFAALNILAHLPLISIANRLLGLVLGLVQALFVVWLGFLILSMFSATNAGLYLMSMVQESPYLSQLYDSNLFLQVVLRATALFV